MSIYGSNQHTSDESCVASFNPPRPAKPKKVKYTKDPDAVMRTLRLNSPYSQEQITDIILPVRVSFESLRTGGATERDVSDISAVIDVTVVRSLAIKKAAVDVAALAKRALDRCRERHARTGRWGLDGPGIADIEQGIDLHEQILALSRPQDMVDALRLVMETK